MDNLIRKFRDVINDSDYILEKYRNINQKDKWSCICSCMDWIDVSIDYIKKNRKRIEEKTYFDMEIFSYISSIALIVEATNQLYRVFYDKNDKPFKGDNSIFKNSQKDDEEYFAHIRACFGAHPTNLNSIENCERNFASYPSNRVLEGNFSVILYTNKINEWGTTFELDFEDIYRYFEKRYSYLESLIEKIEDDKMNYIKKLQSKKIRTEKCLKKQIDILICESEERLNKEWNSYIAKKLSSLINFKITNSTNIPIIKKYLESFKKFVEYFYNDLQYLNTEDREDIFLNTYSNSYSRILENNFIEYDLIEMKNLLKEYVIIDLSMSYSEIKSLCQIGMYFLAKNKKSEVKEESNEEVVIEWLAELEDEISKV